MNKMISAMSHSRVFLCVERFLLATVLLLSPIANATTQYLGTIGGSRTISGSITSSDAIGNFGIYLGGTGTYIHPQWLGTTSFADVYVFTAASSGTAYISSFATSHPKGNGHVSIYAYATQTTEIYDAGIGAIPVTKGYEYYVCVRAFTAENQTFSFTLTLPSVPSIPYYTVTFNANGGSVSPTTRSVKSGTSIGSLPTPTRSGYTFDGWYTSASGGTKITSSKVITGNVTYYAHWSVALPTYTVTFNANGGSVSPTTRSVKSGSSIGTLPTPTKTGYTFVGWYTTPSMKTSTVRVSADTVVSDDVTYYAYWEKIENLTVSANTLTIGVQGECEEIAVAANCDWSVISSISWIEISPQHGYGDGVISITAKKNLSNVPRSGEIVVSNGGISHKVLVSQECVAVNMKIENGVLKEVSLNGAIEIVLPNSVIAIGEKVFRYCSSLKSITIPSTVTSIGNYAFEYCGSLTDISIPDSVKSIGYGAFAECTSLEDLLLPNSIECIDFHTFANCSSLESIFIPGRVSSIDASAFTGCRSLRAFDVDWNNEYYIDVDGFLLDSSGETFVASPGAVTNAVIPSGVKKIGEQAFWKNSQLRHVLIPDGVADIGDSAFSGCDSLASVTIPATVTRIEYCAFACKSLSCVIFKGNAPATGYRIFATASNCTAYVLHTSSGWGVDIPGVWNEVRIEKYVEGNTIITFDYNGGAVSESKRNVEFGTKIGQLPIPVRNGYIFDGWYTAITGGEKITAETISVGNNTYYAHWRGVDDYTPESMFEYRRLDGQVTITKYKGEDKRVNIPQKIEGLPVTGIGSFTFQNCDFIQSVKIPNGVTDIGAFSFDGCSSVASVEIPDSVTNIGSYAFCDCVLLDSVTIPNRITKIEGGVFDCCSSISSITIPESVEIIGDYAFFRCTSLVRIEFEGNAPTILANVFNRVADTCTAYVKRGSMGWGVSIPGKWEGLCIAYIDGGSDPAPTPTPEPDLEPPVVDEGDFTLYDDVEGDVPMTAASVYDGYLYYGDEVAGTIQAKVAKPKKGKAKVTVSIQISGEKKVSLKDDMNVDDGILEIVARDGRDLYLEFGEDGMLGEFDGYGIDGARNFFTSKDKAEAKEADALLAPWIGSLNMIADGGTLSVTIAKKGKVTVKGTIDGVKVSAKAQALIGEDWICIPVVYSKMSVNLAFTLWLPLDGGETEVVGLDAEVGKAGTLKAGAKFHLDEAILSAIEGVVIYNGAPILPDGERVSASGNKWVVADGAKVAKVAYKKGVLSVAPGKKGGEIVNASGLKLTYKVRDGSFSGSFTVYALDGAKFKKHKASIFGVLIDGVGYGTATIKKIGSWAITISR